MCTCPLGYVQYSNILILLCRWPYQRAARIFRYAPQLGHASIKAADSGQSLNLTFQKSRHLIGEAYRVYRLTC